MSPEKQTKSSRILCVCEPSIASVPRKTVIHEYTETNTREVPRIKVPSFLRAAPPVLLTDMLDCLAS